MCLFLSAGQRADVQGYLSGGDGENGGKMAITSLQPGHFGESGSTGQVPVAGRVPASFLGGSGCLQPCLPSRRRDPIGGGPTSPGCTWSRGGEGGGNLPDCLFGFN